MNIETATALLDAAAAERGYPGMFDIAQQNDERWAVYYWYGKSRLVTNKQPSIEAAVERALAWLAA